LKFLLDQHLSTIPQHRWISKLMGFDFVVEYKSGSMNTVANALSRHDTDAAEALALSFSHVRPPERAPATDRRR
jgi:hypothetical protein